MVKNRVASVTAMARRLSNNHSLDWLRLQALQTKQQGPIINTVHFNKGSDTRARSQKNRQVFLGTPT